jgi:hypothetical protein
MYSRAVTGVALTVLVAAIVIFTPASNLGTYQKDEQPGASQLPIMTRQLPQEKGVIPVELKCGNAELSTPDTLEKISCSIKNNTNKDVSAVSLNVSVVIETGGKLSVDSNFLTFETFLHPDFRQERSRNLLSPGEESPVRDGPSTYYNSTIKGVSLQIDYVEFADKTTLGPNQAGARIVSEIREGAAKYKSWLVKQFNRGGKSVNAIAPLLEKNQPLPQEIGIETGDQQQGALMYRNFALKIYRSKGTDGLNRYLK